MSFLELPVFPLSRACHSIRPSSITTRWHFVCHQPGSDRFPVHQHTPAIVDNRKFPSLGQAFHRWEAAARESAYIPARQQKTVDKPPPLRDKFGYGIKIIRSVSIEPMRGY